MSLTDLAEKLTDLAERWETVLSDVGEALDEVLEHNGTPKGARDDADKLHPDMALPARLRDLAEDLESAASWRNETD